MEFPGVSPPGVLAGVNEGALGPVMGVSPRARTDLEGEHPELICGVNAVFDIGKGGINGVLFLLRKRRELLKLYIYWRGGGI